MKDQTSTWHSFVVTDADRAHIVDQVDAQIEAGMIDPPNPYPICSPHWYAWHMTVPLAWQYRHERPELRRHWWHRPVSNGVVVVLTIAFAVGCLAAVVHH
jgi:hypothetical protein